MSKKVAIRHYTKYTYDQNIQIYPQTIRLKPAPHTRTPILSYALNIEPKEHFINWQQDPFGNYNCRVVFPELVKELIIDVEVIVELISFNPFDFFLEEDASKAPYTYESQLKKELAPYLEIVENDVELLELKIEADEFLGQNTIDFLVNINQLVNSKVNYNLRFEPGVQKCSETLSTASGSCRDSAWVLVQLFRQYGMAARFVSGYLVQLKSDEIMLNGPNGPEADFTDLHAWAEVYVPGAGWVGLDATSGLFAGEGHIPLACTPDPISAAPISGFTGKGTATMEYRNTVERIYEKPRVTLPYTEFQLKDIEEVAQKVDQILDEGDVRLTMGGEPTFVSSVDMESDQWNNAADGKEKREQAHSLASALKKEFAPKGLMFNGQGKWYPGEPIPRWQNVMYFRKDGLPVWKDDRLITDPNKKGETTLAQLNEFTKMLCAKLGLSSTNIHEAYEDYYFYAWEAQNLPENLNVDDISEKDGMARNTLKELLEEGINKQAGSVLPIKWDYDHQFWVSSKWKLRREHLFLIPGNSDIGYRLPLKRLPEESETNIELGYVYDPFDVQMSLPNFTDKNLGKQAPKVSEIEIEDKEKTVKQAMCFELKNGNLSVFLPPFDTIEPFLIMVAAINETCLELSQQVVLQGYSPPFDNRMVQLAVTPDPGVIEVNVQPSKNWEEISKTYAVLFEAAKQNNLGAQKFMLDGRHTGTGGGNHITLGGQVPSDSPLLRRPDLLESMLRFWVNHPGLSYLFSSTFVGMTSQAPRLDEGKPGSIYNLEIAFRELNKVENPPNWLVDRLFRNILTDITGNTHRAEFCIDKMFSPDSMTGRLGILELRGFDMPPHKDMCLFQLLLVRSLVATFWKNPYKAKLIRWGAVLNDKFMIHHFVKRDMEDIFEYLRANGIQMENEWLNPFYEFRFPLLGEVQIEDMKVTLRSGIEPWNVLGEEITKAGTARYVDSSMERLEVKVEGINIDRYWLLCNDQRVRLTSTNQPEQYVAGIRYKAWAPPSALHPTIDVDTPLRFDIYDTWNNRSIGGCKYHVVHPGGRNYESIPVNALEAEGRRITRFQENSHSPRQMSTIVDQEGGDVIERRYVVVGDKEDASRTIIPKQSLDNDIFPFTLDLQFTK